MLLVKWLLRYTYLRVVMPLDTDKKKQLCNFWKVNPLAVKVLFTSNKRWVYEI